MVIAANAVLHDRHLITYSHRLYAWCEPLLGVFERKGAPREPGDAAAHSDDTYQVIIFGLGRYGTAIGMRLERHGIRVLGVDFNPLAVRRWRELGLDAEYGDATDPEFVAGMPMTRTQWIVSTTPIHPGGLSHEDTRTTLIQLTRSAGFRGRVAVASHHLHNSEELAAAGADLVLEPFQDAADRAVELLSGSREEVRSEFPPLRTEDKALS